MAWRRKEGRRITGQSRETSNRGKFIVNTNATGLVKTISTNVDGKIDATVRDVTVLNLDGSRTETVSQLNNLGATISATATTTAMNGLSSVSLIDENGDGVVDIKHVDTIVLNADGSRIETVLDNNMVGSTSGTLRDLSTTTTSANGLSITRNVDSNGDGKLDYTETVSTVQTAAATPGVGGTAFDATGNVTGRRSGDVLDTVVYYNPDGSVESKVITTTASNGLRETIQTDLNGDGSIDETRTIVKTQDAATGNLIETISDYAGRIGVDATTRKSVEEITTSANGLTTTTSHDYNGDGTVDDIQVDALTLNTDGSTVETVTETKGGFVKTSVTTTSADRKTVGTVTTDTLTTTSGYWTAGYYMTDPNFAGSGHAGQIYVPAKYVGTSSTGTLDSHTKSIAVQANGSIINTEIDLTAAGVQAGKFVTTTSASGLVISTTRDDNGDGVTDETMTSTTVLNDNGSTTKTFTDVNGVLNALSTGALESETVVTTTSGNGLTTNVITTGMNGADSIAHSQLSVTLLNADGTTTTTDTETLGSQSDQKITTVSANGLSKTTQLSTLNNGIFDRTDVLITSLDSSTKETLTVLNQNGTLAKSSVTTTSADGRTQNIAVDTNGDGIVDHLEALSQGLDGSITDTTRNQNASGTLLDSVWSNTSANGLSKTIKVDSNGDGVWDDSRSTVTTLNADGTRTKTVSEYNASGVLLGQIVSNISLNGYVTTMQYKNGAGVVDRTVTNTTMLNADGTITSTATTVLGTAGATDSFSGSGGVAAATSTVTTSGDRLTVTENFDVNGDAHSDIVDTSVTAANGVRTETRNFQNAAGTILTQKITTTSADGRFVTLAYNDPANALNNVLETTMVSGDGSGSYSWTRQNSAGVILESATHLIDSNDVDHIHLVLNGVSTNIAVSVTQEREYIAQIGSIYEVVLGRDMTTAETQAWAKYYSATGLNLVQLTGDLLGSNEYAQTHPTSSNIDLVNSLYQNTFGRAPSSAEMTSWVSQLNGGTLTRSDFIIDLAKLVTGALGQQENEIVTTNAVGQITTESFYNKLNGSLDGLVELSYSATGQATATVSGTRATIALSNATINLAANSSAMITGNGDTITTATGAKIQVATLGSVNTLNGATIVGLGNGFYGGLITSVGNFGGGGSQGATAFTVTGTLAAGLTYTDSGNAASWASIAFAGYNSTSGKWSSIITTNDDGSHAIVGGVDGLTLNSIHNDIFTGGGNNETFVLSANYGHDLITDFGSHATGAGHDFISLAANEFANFAAVMNAAVTSGSDTIITGLNGDQLVLSGITKTTLAGLSADFTFHA